MIKYILITLLLLLNLLWGGELDCAPIQQNTTSKDDVWKCPPLPNYKTHDNDKIVSELTDASFDTGDYSCQYSYVNSATIAQTCRYSSAFFKKTNRAIKDKMYGLDEKGRTGKGVFDINVGDEYSANSISVSDFNKFGVTAPSYMAGKVQEVLNEAHRKLKEQSRLLHRDHDVTSLHHGQTDAKEFKGNGYKNLAAVSTYLSGIDTITYKHLVEPYLKPNLKDTMQKEDTFSNFIAGLVTLNPDVVSGYNEDSGSLLFDEDWKTRATTVSAEKTSAWTDIAHAGHVAQNWVRSAGAFFGLVEPVSATTEATTVSETLKTSDNSGTEWMLHVSSWIDIFELKLWGYYYNLQRRLDLGYDVISMQLFWIMAGWFILLGFSRQGVSHLINRGNETKMTEEHWMKALAMVVGITVFFISPSTPISSTNGGAAINGANDMEQEMRKNRTIIKYIIRESADYGANFGTMISDLGLDAFLQFVVKKQEVYSTDEISNVFDTGVMALSYYYPAYQIAEQCKKYYVIPKDSTFYGTQEGVISVNESWSKSNFATKMNLVGISYPLCKKAFTIIGATPRNLIYSAKETEEKLNNINQNMALAVSNLVYSNIALQDRLGWVNSFTIPVTYFMLKNSDMFLSKGIDYESIKKAADAETNGAIAKSTEEVKDEAGGVKALEKGWGEISGATQQGVAYVISTASNLLLYNILPGFSAMQKGVQSYLDTVYANTLREGKNDNTLLGDILLKVTGIKWLGGLSVLGTLFDKFASISLDSPLVINGFILLVSFLIALYAWGFMLSIASITIISSMILFKTVLYFKDLMIHVITSVFVFVWAFAKQGGEGERKMTNFIKDTLVLMIYPSLIVLGSFMFVFIYELFSVLYTFLMTILVNNEKNIIGLITEARSETDTFSAYMNMYSLQKITQITVDIMALFVAWITIMRFPEFVLKKMGINEDESMMIGSVGKEAGQKTEKFTNPLG